MNEPVIDSHSEPKKKPANKRNWWKLITISVIALTAGYIHYSYVAELFENDRHFSHLSDMEREMSLRTEMGFYYSYYKTIVEAPVFMAGFTKLMYDDLVEYPNEVNAINRFNIHPEVLIGAVYRYLEPVLNTSARVRCGAVARGPLPAVRACSGLGRPLEFYLHAVWLLAGVLVAALFLHACVLSSSVLGGLLCVVQYFTNHSECTRVQWAPNERENMTAPLLAVQAALITLHLRRPRSVQLQVSIFILNTICLLFWQFTQFIFLTQLAIFFVMEQLRIINIKSLCILLHSHFCGLHMAVLMFQGNDMLKSSLFTSFFLVLSAYCLLFSSFRLKVENSMDLLMESALVVIRIAVVVSLSFYLKKLISEFMGVEEDSHIWDIFYSKIGNFKSFHTLLYTCSPVFDFLPFSTIQNLTYSLLIPFAVIGVSNVCVHWLANARKSYNILLQEIDNLNKKPKALLTDDEDSGIENTEVKKKNKNLIKNHLKSKAEASKRLDRVVLFLNQLTIEPAIFYNVSQMVVYGVMAALVMRLKLLFVPQMCIVSALAMNKNYYSVSKKNMKYIFVLWAVAFVPVIYRLVANVSEEMSHIGEFSDYELERLLGWVSRAGGRAAVAASMPLSAAVMLAARRAVVTHPHYEHLHARQRAYTVYKMYGPFSAEEYYEELSKLKVGYLIVETKYCYGRSSSGCSFASIWAAEGRGGAPLCRELLTTRVDHFYPVYRSAHYAVFKIHDYSVRYMPRSFDT